MLRFVEKTRNSHRQTKRPQRGLKCCQHLDLRFHHLSMCTVNCLETRLTSDAAAGFKQTKRPRARTEVLSARGEESKPVAHPCRGPGGQAGDHQQRQGHPVLAPGKRGWPPTSLGRWGVTTLSANLAGDDSWVAGIELATASVPPARGLGSGGVALRASTPPPLSCNPLLNHALRFGAFSTLPRFRCVSICSLTARHYPCFPSGPSLHWPLAATRRLCHRQFTGRRGAGHRRGDAKDRTWPDHGDQALSYYSPARRFRRRNRPIFSKFIPRQPFLATAHWSSCLVGPGAIGAGDARFASSSGQSSNVCPFASRFPHS